MPAFTGAFVVRAFEQAKALLREALENGEIDQVAEIRSQAEALRSRAAREGPGKDALLAATELVRRAERCLGAAIRQGQEAGTVRGPHDGKLTRRPGSTEPLRSPREFATMHELSGGQGGQPGIYNLTDGVTDDDFEAALKEAAAEGNLSRANVARKARAHAEEAGGPGGDWIPEPGDRYGEGPAQRRRLIRRWAAEGYSSRQMADLLGMGAEGVRKIARDCGTVIAADKVAGNSLHLDSNRIVRETVHSLEGLAMGIGLADAAGLDPEQAAEWAASLTSSTRVLSRFARKLKETARERS